MLLLVFCAKMLHRLLGTGEWLHLLKTGMEFDADMCLVEFVSI